METMEDTLSIPMCGMFLLLLSGMCFGAMSAVTVKNLLNNYYDILQKLKKLTIIPVTQHMAYRFNLEFSIRSHEQVSSNCFLNYNKTSMDF
jgi:hypothetical protein